MAGVLTPRTLRLIGYWLGPGEPGWPDAAAFVDPRPDPAEQLRVAAYLRAGTMWVAAAGFSLCRLCGATNGSVELTDGRYFVWPEGLAHYVTEHGVRLPHEVTAVMARPPDGIDPDRFFDDLLTGVVVVDQAWWRGADARD